MTPEAIARAFDRFYKGSGSRGSGLGLTIAHRIVTALGGSIQVQSDLYKGTRFDIRIPYILDMAKQPKLTVASSNKARPAGNLRPV